MSASLDDLDGLEEMFGIEDILDHLGFVCDTRSETQDEAGNEENSRRWRVRANAIRKLAREYVEFCAARDA